MRLTMSIAAAGLLVFAESARASSIIPSNYVDDFGSLEVSNPTQTPRELPVAHASPIPSNYVDDFGSLVPSEPGEAKKTVLTWHASQIPSNYVDDFGLVEDSGQAETREPSDLRLSVGSGSAERDAIAP